ncbi:MAG: CoA transferase [Chloroflexi bacterium]|nr:CoA transferase [Chloroflexota bacterium]
MEGPLSGVKVLDVGAFGVGPAACGLLGMLGANVIRVEPHTGDGLMFVASKMGGMGTAYVGVHYNKKSIVLNLLDKRDRETGLKLVGWADILVENRRVGTMDKMGFDYDSLAKVNPGLIYISSPAFGTTGPFANYAAADHYIQAASGFVQLNGKEGGDAEIFRNIAFVDMINSSLILQAALTGLFHRSNTGAGQFISTSSFNGGIALQSSRIAEFFATGAAPRRMGSANPNIVPSQAFPTLDGSYVLVSVPREEFWPRLCRALEIGDLAEDPRFSSNAARVWNRAELIPLLEEKFRDKPRVWWMIHLKRLGVPCGFVAKFEDIVRDPQVIHNQILVERESPWGKAVYVNAPWRFSRTPTLPVEATHKPDADREEVLGLLAQGAAHRAGAKEGPAALPLEGIRVVDLTEDITGAFCSMNLADAGAEVIKVESLKGDWLRQVSPAAAGESALFMALNRNKKSVSVDIATEAGKEVVYRLVKDADIVIESYGPGAADRMELGYADMQKIKHNIVYCSISPFGEDGPYAGRPASELELQGLAGVMQYLGEPGEPPVRLGADATSIAAGVHAAAAILAALYYRQRTGFGQKVSVPIMNVALWMGRTWLLTYSNPDSYGGYFLTGPFDHAETGYKAQDKQIMFGLLTSTEARARQNWTQFCHKVGLEDLLADPYYSEKGFKTLGMGRDAQEMKPLFESAFANWKADDLIELIQGIGGMGAAFMTYEELYGEPPHPQVAANEMVVSFDHPRAGKVRAIGVPYKFRGVTLPVRVPPPLLGEHTGEVMASLGYSGERIDRLEKAGLIKRASPA